MIKEVGQTKIFSPIFSLISYYINIKRENRIGILNFQWIQSEIAIVLFELLFHYNFRNLYLHWNWNYIYKLNSKKKIQLLIRFYFSKHFLFFLYFPKFVCFIFIYTIDMFRWLG